MDDRHDDDRFRTTEIKRRRRELIAVAIASLTLIAFVLAQTTLPPLRSRTSLVSNLVVILLFDLSFILLGLMLILVGRNLAKAIFERRRGLIGSKLQARLVFGFSAVALVPSVFLLYVAGTFLRADIDSWFNPEYERVLGMDSKGHGQVIKALVPMSEILKYAPDLRSITSGRGAFEARFSHYDEVPPVIAEKVIKEAREAREAAGHHAQAAGH